MGSPNEREIYEGLLRPGDVGLTKEEADRFKELSLDSRMDEFQKRFQEQGAIAPANDAPQREMPRYKCHKEVWALKIDAIHLDVDVAKVENRETNGGAFIYPADEGFAPFQVDEAYVRKHKPEAGGYYVVCKDGYKSYSPAQAFEEGYTRMTRKLMQ